MTDRPILMSASMVRALLDGRKTQTRRLAWQQCRTCKGRGQAWRLGPSTKHNILGTCQKCDGSGRRPTTWQKLKPGDRLWCRETWAPVPNTGSHDWDSTRAFRVDQSIYPDAPWARNSLLAQVEKWRPSIHMPRWASRITLVVTETRIDRLRHITRADARAEGFGPLPDGGNEWHAFLDYWNELHGPNATDANPEVVALTFTVHQCNIDEMEVAA